MKRTATRALIAALAATLALSGAVAAKDHPGHAAPFDDRRRIDSNIGLSGDAVEGHLVVAAKHGSLPKQLPFNQIGRGLGFAASFRIGEGGQFLLAWRIGGSA